MGCSSSASTSGENAARPNTPTAKAASSNPLGTLLHQEATMKHQAKLQAFRAQYGEEACPEAGCRVHFSGALMHDDFVERTASIPYVEDNMSEYVGKGRFPENSCAFPKAIENSFDSIAVDAGTRVTIYSEPNFEGCILWDKVGPAIVVNIKWKDMSCWEFCKGQPYSQVLASKWKDPLNAIFPPSVREFSTTDMHSWNTGSLVIQGGQAIPENLKNNNPEYTNLSNETYVTEPCDANGEHLLF